MSTVVPPVMPAGAPATPSTSRVGEKPATGHGSGSGGGLSGGIIALIIIAIIVLVVLVAALAAFIQRQMDVKRSRRCVRPAAGGVPAGMSGVSSKGMVSASDSSGGHTTTTHAAQQHDAAHAHATPSKHQEATALSSAPSSGQSQPASLAAQQNLAGTQPAPGSGYCGSSNLVKQVQPGRLSSVLPAAQINNSRHQQSLRAKQASFSSNPGTCAALGNPNAPQQLQSINAALNTPGTSTVTTAGARVRALSQATQSVLTPADRANIASTAKGNGAAMVGNVKGQYLVDLNNHPMGAQTTNGGRSIVPDTNDPGKGTQQPTPIAQAFSGKPVEKGVTADMAKRMQYAYDITNFAPESSQFTSVEVAAQRANNLALQAAAARNPAMAAQYLAGVGATTPVTMSGIRSAVARQGALGRVGLSKPVKNGFGFLDAAIRAPMALPMMSASPPTFNESTAAAYARASQSCTAAQI